MTHRGYADRANKEWMTMQPQDVKPKQSRDLETDKAHTILSRDFSSSIIENGGQLVVIELTQICCTSNLSRRCSHAGRVGRANDLQASINLLTVKMPIDSVLLKMCC
jgi:hypothetical protein